MSLSRFADGRLLGRAPLLLVLALVLVLPGLVWPGTAAVYGTRPLVVQLVAAALLLTLLPRTLWPKETVLRFLRTGPNLAILLFVAWMGFEGVRSPFRSYAVQQLLAVAGGAVVYFVVAYRLPARRSLRSLTAGLAVGVIGAVIVACILYSRQDQQGLAGAFGNPQMLASFLMLMLPLMLVASQTEDSSSRRGVAQFAAVFAAGALVVTGNRSAWLGGAVALALCALLAYRHVSRSWSMRRSRQQILAYGLILLAALALFFALSGVGGSFMNRLFSFAGGGAQGSFQWRAQSWSAAYGMFLQAPLTGLGLGAYALMSAKFGAPSFSAAVANGLLPPTMAEMPHNLYFQLLAEGGLVALVLYLAVLAGFFAHCGRALVTITSNTRRWLLIGTISAVAGQVVDAFANPAYQFADVSLFFWLILGIGVAATRPLKVRQEEAAGADAAAARLRLPARVGWSFAHAAVLASAVFLVNTARASHRPIPDYTEIVDCKITPNVQELPFPPRRAVECKEFKFRVTFKLTEGGKKTVNVTDDPGTTWTTDSACVFMDAPGEFCWERPVGEGCPGTTVHITARWDSEGPAGFCEDRARLRLLKKGQGGLN